MHTFTPSQPPPPTPQPPNTRWTRTSSARCSTTGGYRGTPTSCSSRRQVALRLGGAGRRMPAVCRPRVRLLPAGRPLPARDGTQLAGGSIDLGPCSDSGLEAHRRDPARACLAPHIQGGWRAPVPDPHSPAPSSAAPHRPLNPNLNPNLNPPHTPPHTLTGLPHAHPPGHRHGVRQWRHPV